MRLAVEAFKFKGSKCEISLLVLCLLCWAVGGGFFIWAEIELGVTFTQYVSGSIMFIAVLLMHFGLRFFSLWVPVGFLLNRWQMKSKVVPIVYGIGSCMAIIFSICAFVIVLSYGKEDVLEEEYTKGIKKDLDDGKFPSTLENLMQRGCCGWNTPADLSPKGRFDIGRFVETDKEFMSKVAQCYGNSFKVSGKNGNIIYSPNDKKFTKKDIPPGCVEIIYSTTNRIMNLILWAAICTTVLTLATVSLYLYNYIKMPSPQIAPGGNVPAYPSQTFSQVRRDHENPAQSATPSEAFEASSGNIVP